MMTLHLLWQVPIAAAVLFAVLVFVAFRWLLPMIAYIQDDFDWETAPVLSTLWLVPYLLVVSAAFAVWLYDVLFNLTLGALMFAQWPLSKSMTDHRWRLTFSDRLQHILGGCQYVTEWREALALPIARFVNWIKSNHIRGV